MSGINNPRPTNYNELKNRCNNCGHRLKMHNKYGCSVVTGLTDAIACKCKVKG